MEGTCRSLSTSSDESGSGGWAQVAPDEDPQEETTCSFIHLSEGSVFPLALNANSDCGVEWALQGSIWYAIGMLNANAKHCNWVSVKAMSV